MNILMHFVWNGEGYSFSIIKLIRILSQESNGLMTYHPILKIENSNVK